MSRARSNGESSMPSKFGAAPSSNPLESSADYRAFLIRSLDRCDTEFTALTELNRSLHKVKATIVETCGEETLIDLGEGLIKLTPDEDDIVGLRIPDQGQDLCVEFLTRMKLRRRLLNRLARRLNRISQAMDGNDISPPMPPKYGDLRLHIDPAQVNEYAAHWKLQEVAKNTIKERRQRREHSTTVVADDAPSSIAPVENPYEVLKEYNDSYEKALLPSTGVIKYTILDQPEGDDHMNAKFGAGIGAGHRTMTAREKEAECKRWKAALFAKVPDQPSFGEIGTENRVFALEQRRKRIVEESLEFANKNSKTKVAHINMDEVKKEKSEDNTVTQADDENSNETLFGTNIKNGEEEEKSEGNSEQKENEKSSDEEKSETDEDSEDSDDEEDEDDDDDDEQELDNKETKTIIPNDSKVVKDENKIEQIVLPNIPKRIKPISLIAVPSFHEQDMKRIRLIHADLMATSITEHARLRITETTTDYNNAYRLSTEIYHRRVKCQEEVQKMAKQHRAEIAKLNNDYSMRVSISKTRYLKEKQSWNIQKARQVMQSMHGQMPVGTQQTQMASSHSNQIVNTVGLILGRIVDAVVLKTERGSYDGETFPAFQQLPPPDFNNMVVNRSTGETFNQRQTRLETTLRNETADLNNRFQTSEQERDRAWRKLLKTKAEFDGGRRRFDPNLMPLPSLRSSGMVATPALTPPAAAMATYVPQNRSYAGPESQSKYSAARIRGRISSDGSVMPASEPKRGKGGLYIRPAGRKRAGMDWDAHRGIWVPEVQHRG